MQSIGACRQERPPMILRNFFSPIQYFLLLWCPIEYRNSQCLKIAQKVAFNIASEASYVYILSGQKFIKNAKNGRFWRLFETWSSQSQSVTIHVSFKSTKNCWKKPKFINSNETYRVIFKQCGFLELSTIQHVLFGKSIMVKARDLLSLTVLLTFKVCREARMRNKQA